LKKYNIDACQNRKHSQDIPVSYTKENSQWLNSSYSPVARPFRIEEFHGLFARRDNFIEYFYIIIVTWNANQAHYTSFAR